MFGIDIQTVENEMLRKLIILLKNDSVFPLPFFFPKQSSKQICSKKLSLYDNISPLLQAKVNICEIKKPVKTVLQLFSAFNCFILMSYMK